MSAVFSQTISSRRREAGPAAVTLLEILVVLAIVATLAGLVLPAYRAVMSKADQTRSLSNLHAIGGGRCGFHRGSNGRDAFEWS